MSTASANLPALPSSLSPEGNLSRYLSEIRKFPLLEPQQEFMLAKAWREHGLPVSQFTEVPEAVAERLGVRLVSPNTRPN